MTPSRKALREATAGAHDRVDAAFAGFDVTDRQDYARFLRAHAEVVWPLEAELDAAGAARVVADWPGRKRGALLREDLALLRQSGDSPLVVAHAASAEADDLGSRPEDRWAAREWDDAALAGALYVLEGSRLGGRFIARQLPSGFPRAYLDGDQRAEKWQQLLSRIEPMLPVDSALQTAIDAAHEVFSAFERSARRWAKG